MPDLIAGAGNEIAVAIPVRSQPGQCVRPVGCDIAAGQTVLAAGQVITSAEIGLLATVSDAAWLCEFAGWCASDVARDVAARDPGGMHKRLCVRHTTGRRRVDWRRAGGAREWQAPSRQDPRQQPSDAVGCGARGRGDARRLRCATLSQHRRSTTLLTAQRDRVCPTGIIQDDFAQVEARLLQLMNECDVLITSGGVSMVRAALAHGMGAQAAGRAKP